MSEPYPDIIPEMNLPRRLVELVVPQAGMTIRVGGWSPDGKGRIAAIRQDDAGSCFAVGVTEMATGRVVRVLDIPYAMAIAEYETVEMPGAPAPAEPPPPADPVYLIRRPEDIPGSVAVAGKVKQKRRP